MRALCAGCATPFQAPKLCVSCVPNADFPPSRPTFGRGWIACRWTRSRRCRSQPEVWHVETISPATEATLEMLRDASLLEGFYLAGGTALALHLGHRTSEDLDFFAEDLFDEAILLQYLQTLTDFH